MTDLLGVDVQLEKKIIATDEIFLLLLKFQRCVQGKKLYANVIFLKKKVTKRNCTEN